jgi:hypothetical protein
MKLLCSSLLLCMLAIPARNALAEPGRDCLSYEPVKTKLTGTLLKKTFPGPPSYESIANGDKPETYWLLVLSHAVCVNADKKDSFNVAYRDVHRIQLVFLDGTMYKTHRVLLGKRAVVEGNLIGANSGHHHTPVLLIVSALSKP